jgi:hypothetical protein
MVENYVVTYDSSSIIFLKAAFFIFLRSFLYFIFLLIPLPISSHMDSLNCSNSSKSFMMASSSSLFWVSLNEDDDFPSVYFDVLEGAKRAWLIPAMTFSTVS